MNTANWERVKQIFETALEQPAAARPQFVRETCGDDEGLFNDVASLLAAHEQTGNIIEDNAFAFNHVSETDGKPYEGRQFGHYRIISEIGHGGMGAVFLAERSDGEFTQRVALKIVRQTIVSSELERHFRRERQILASLNHPNIAKLLDGGVSENGEPFIAMEYVDGEGLLDFAVGFTLEEKFRLFLKICNAVSYAHRNLIVHRDIKPSNILINDDGEPKLLDFGLARIEDEGLSGEATQTVFRALTPAYASPEQLQGEAVTTASDIYSLGIVLYELLSGEKPYDTENKNLEEILRTIRETAPKRFDQISNPQFVLKDLSGDIENVVGMALRKEPERRYRSVEAFADDIERSLNGLPVTARPNTFQYRASKFVSRNLAMVSIAAVLILALIAGVATVLWQANEARKARDRAERRFNDVRQLSNSLLFEMAPKIELLNGSTEAREILVRRALEYLDSLASESANDVQLQSELASAYEKIGDLQGNPNKPNLSNFAGAIQSYEKAASLRHILPSNAANRGLLAQNYREAAAIRYFQNDIKGSLQASHDALNIYQGLISDGNITTDQRTIYVETLIDYAQTFSLNNQYARAIPLCRQALDELSKLDQNDREVRRLLSKGFAYLGNALSWDDKQAEAEIEMTKAVAMSEAAAADFPNDTSIRQTVWRVYILASSIYEGSKNDVSLMFAQRALQTAERAVESDPADVQARQNLGRSFSRVGICNILLKRISEGFSSLERAEGIFQELIEREPNNQYYQNELGRLYTRLGDAKLERADRMGALRAFERSAEIFEKIALRDDRNTLARRDMAQSLKSIGLIHGELGQNDKALQNLRKSFEILNALKEQNAIGEYDNKLIDEVQRAISKFAK